MFHKFSLVEGVEVTMEGLGNDRIYYGLACLWASAQLKGLVNLLVCGLKLKLLRLIVSHTQLRYSWSSTWLTQSFNHVLMSFQLLHLLLCEVTLISRITLERQRIVGILRMSFVVNIFLSILPIGELGRIVTGLLGWCVILGNRFKLSLWWKNLKWSKRGFVSGPELHRMRVDNLSFFLEVKGIFFSQNTGLPYLIRKLLLIVGDCTTRIGIADEAIRTSVSFYWRLTWVTNYLRLVFTLKSYFHLKSHSHKFGTSFVGQQFGKP